MRGSRAMAILELWPSNPALNPKSPPLDEYDWDRGNNMECGSLTFQLELIFAPFHAHKPVMNER